MGSKRFLVIDRKPGEERKAKCARQTEIQHFDQAVGTMMFFRA